MKLQSVWAACLELAKFPCLLVINSVFKEILCLVVLLFGFLGEEKGSVNCKYCSSLKISILLSLR